MEALRIYNRILQNKNLADLFYIFLFGLLSILFSFIKLKIHNYENAFTDLREIPLVISIFYIRNPFIILLLCLLSLLSLFPNESQLYWPSFYMHLLPLFTMWLVYHWIRNKNIVSWKFGLLWLVVSCIYYLVLIIPCLIIVYHIMEVNSIHYSFWESYKSIVVSTRFEIAATALVASIYLVQMKVRDSLEQSEKELKHVNYNLDQKNKDLDNFIYTASHELKAPISNIEASIHLLNVNPPEDEETKEMYDLILVSAEKFKQTANNLAEISKVQQLREKDTMVNDVQKIVDIIIDRFSEKIKQADPLIETDFTNAPNIKFSRQNLLRIIENVFINAIEFRSPDRKLKIFIDTEETNNYVILNIRDNGIGIKKDYQDKIFSIFRKAKGSNDGKGIGLYLTKRILENDNGRIEVKSEEGKGATFRMFFNK